MNAALAEAGAARDHGDVPVGAVIVRNGAIIARAHNERELTNDPTAHAELLAIRRACEAIGEWRLSECTLYVTLEPCVMCAGAIVGARIPQLVFAAFDPKAGAVGSLYDVCVDPRLNHEVEVTNGVLADESSQLLRNFFRGRRSESTEL